MLLDLPTGWTQRGYTFVRQLQSSPAQVFVLRDSTPSDAPNDECDFVAKVVHLEHLDVKARLIAQQELSVLKSLHHPNVVAYRDSWEDADSNSFVTGPHLVLVMELAHDGDLRRPKEEAIDNGSRISPDWILLWARQMLLGLQYIHQVRLVHRDLKSANVFLTENRARCLVGDFGISKVLESTLFATTCVGTPAYMAPEIVRNEKYAACVDMWAFGVILFELIALELPFSCGNLLGLVYQIATKDPDYSKLDGTDHVLVKLVMDCMRKPPDERPSADMLLTQCPLFIETGLPTILPSPVKHGRQPMAALPRPKGIRHRPDLPPLSPNPNPSRHRPELPPLSPNPDPKPPDGDERLRAALVRARQQRRQLSNEDLDHILLDSVSEVSGAVNDVAAIEAKVNIFLQRRRGTSGP